MKISKILSYVVLAVGAVGIILWFLMNSAFSALQASGTSEFSEEGFAAVSPLYSLTIVVFVIVLAVTLISVFTSLAKNPAGLTKALIGIGAFIVVLIVCYIVADGSVDNLGIKKGVALSEGESKWIGAGLYGFYFLTIIAIGLMLLSGVKKLIGK